jgi:hypothetical protein
MKSPALWKLVGVVVLALVAFNVLLGINLLPSMSESQEKGTFAPWVITWLLVVVCAGCGLALAKFILTSKRT